MIPNQWYILLESKEVKSKPVSVTRMGASLVSWRDGTGEVSCLRDKCPHRGVEFSKGKVVHGHIQCPSTGLCCTRTAVWWKLSSRDPQGGPSAKR